jgi:hypothetical protein
MLSPAKNDTCKINLAVRMLFVVQELSPAEGHRE